MTIVSILLIAFWQGPGLAWPGRSKADSGDDMNYQWLLAGKKKKKKAILQHVLTSTGGRNVSREINPPNSHKLARNAPKAMQHP